MRRSINFAFACVIIVGGGSEGNAQTAPGVDLGYSHGSPSPQTDYQRANPGVDLGYHPQTDYQHADVEAVLGYPGRAANVQPPPVQTYQPSAPSDNQQPMMSAEDSAAYSAKIRKMEHDAWTRAPVTEQTNSSFIYTSSDFFTLASNSCLKMFQGDRRYRRSRSHTEHVQYSANGTYDKTVVDDAGGLASEIIEVANVCKSPTTYRPVVSELGYYSDRTLTLNPYEALHMVCRSDGCDITRGRPTWR